MVAVLDADTHSVTKARAKLAVAVAVLDWLLTDEAIAIRLISSRALIAVLDCEVSDVDSGRSIDNAADAVLDTLFTAVESERAISNAEVADSEPEATADSNTTSVVVLRVIDPVLLLLVSDDDKSR